MSPLISKKQMTEEDIKLNFITPALLNRGWQDRITMETAVKFTDGKVNLKGNLVVRETPKKADYILYICANNPIAIVEAKDNNHSVSFGLQQAIQYAGMLDLPFAYSSNGDGFREHDFLTGQERDLGLDEFPTPDELIARYNQEKSVTPQQEQIRKQPYYSSQNTYPPRYYQRIAINRTVEAIANGQQRLLLVMATGTGKTYTAFQIVYRLLQSGMKQKILYLADRNILVDQSIMQDFAPLEKVIHKINVAKDDRTTITSHQVYFSLYQQLVGDDDQEHFSELFSPDFFDLIIVDAYGIIGLNSKGSINKGFEKLSPILFSPQKRLTVELRRCHAQIKDFSAKRPTAGMHSSIAGNIVPTNLLQRQSIKLSSDVDLYRGSFWNQNDVSLACAA